VISSYAGPLSRHRYARNAYVRTSIRGISSQGNALVSPGKNISYGPPWHMMRIAEWSESAEPYRTDERGSVATYVVRRRYRSHIPQRFWHLIAQRARTGGPYNGRQSSLVGRDMPKWLHDAMPSSCALRNISLMTGHSTRSGVCLPEHRRWLKSKSCTKSDIFYPGISTEILLLLYSGTQLSDSTARRISGVRADGSGKQQRTLRMSSADTLRRIV